MAIDIASKETTRILRQVDNDLNNIESGVNTNSTLISSTLARVNTNSANISANHTAILTNSTHISSTRARVNTNSTLISSTLARVNTTSANHSTLCSSIGTTTRTNSALNSSIISMLANGTYRGNANYEIPGTVSIYRSVSSQTGNLARAHTYAATGYFPYVHVRAYTHQRSYSGAFVSLRFRLNTFAISIRHSITTPTYNAVRGNIIIDTQRSITSLHSLSFMSSAMSSYIDNAISPPVYYYYYYEGLNMIPINVFHTYISSCYIWMSARTTNGYYSFAHVHWSRV